jgi:flavin-dependent dehydrogenase
VAVVDRSVAGTDTVSTHALMRAGVLQLSRWGVLPDLVAAGTPAIRHTTFHYADGGTAHVSVRSSPGVEALYAPRRHLLDAVLVDAAADAGADVLHGTAVVGLLRDQDGRVVGVRTAGRRGSGLDLRAALTVGADGIGSVVARDVNATTLVRGEAASALLYRYVAGMPADGYVWAYGDAVAAGLIPTNDDETCVFVSTTPELMRGLRSRGQDGAFESLLEAVDPTVADLVRAGIPASRLHGWRGVPGHVRRSFGPGWALVGDAGYFKDPISTHGITDALRDAELLADAVLSTHAGTPTEDAFRSYQDTRDRLSTALFQATESVCRYDWSPDEIRALLRRLSAAMSDELDHLTAREQAQADLV